MYGWALPLGVIPMEIRIPSLSNDCKMDPGSKRIRRWFSNPVLLEWDQSIPWSDAQSQTGYKGIVELTRNIAIRVVPLGVVLFAMGFWLIGRIPGGGGPIPYSWQLKLGGAWLLFWLLPYAVLRLGFVKATRGACVRVRLHVRGIQFADAHGDTPKEQVHWSRFDAFEIRRWNGSDLLRLRFRSSWLSRKFGTPILAVEFGAAQVSGCRIREVLQDRGLNEEPLNESFANPQVWN